MTNHDSSESNEKFRPRIVWQNLIAQLSIHLGFMYGLYFILSLKMKFYSYIWFFFLIISSGFGITCGAHRLWSHRSFKAKLPLRIILMLLFTISGQRDAYTWALDHRIHHKFSETDADPHDSRRGFFFAHVGWLFLTPHPKVVEKRKIIDLSDLEADEVVMWQKKYYPPLFLLLNIIIPMFVPHYFWNEDVWISFWTCFVCRFCTTLNIAFSVNSFAHMHGKKPYDKQIMPVENIFVSLAAMGEGWHNFHHVFPFDYKTGEFGGFEGYKYNITTAIIDFLSWMGLIYERKFATPEMISKKAHRSGDGSHSSIFTHEYAHKTSLWGYGDSDLDMNDKKVLETLK